MTTDMEMKYEKKIKEYRDNMNGYIELVILYESFIQSHHGMRLDILDYVEKWVKKLNHTDIGICGTSTTRQEFVDYIGERMMGKKYVPHHLAEICKIESISSHPNADNLVIVNLTGTRTAMPSQVITSNKYNKGDLVIFISEGAVLPNDLILKNNIISFMNHKKVKKVKVRGVLSDGIILDMPSNDRYPGEDMTMELGISFDASQLKDMDHFKI